MRAREGDGALLRGSAGQPAMAVSMATGAFANPNAGKKKFKRAGRKVMKLNSLRRSSTSASSSKDWGSGDSADGEAMRVAGMLGTTRGRGGVLL